MMSSVLLDDANDNLVSMIITILSTCDMLHGADSTTATTTSISLDDRCRFVPDPQPAAAPTAM